MRGRLSHRGKTQQNCPFFVLPTKVNADLLAKEEDKEENKEEAKETQKRTRTRTIRLS